MSSVTGVEGYLEAAGYEFRRGRESSATRAHLPVITISRQAGSGAHVVAQELVARIHELDPRASPPWTVFDRNLVERVLKEHHLPERMAEFMPEDQVAGIAGTIDELLGVHPPTWTLVRKTADTILRLAEIGNVIVIGRGANILTDRLDHAFHVRLVGSERRRLEHVQEYQHLDARAAEGYVHSMDQGRRRYVRKYYGKDIDDPLLYHLVINTDRVTYREAGRMIAEATFARLGGSRSVGGGPSPHAVEGSSTTA